MTALFNAFACGFCAAGSLGATLLDKPAWAIAVISVLSALNGLLALVNWQRAA